MTVEVESTINECVITPALHPCPTYAESLTLPSPTHLPGSRAKLCAAIQHDACRILIGGLLSLGPVIAGLCTEKGHFTLFIMNGVKK